MTGTGVDAARPLLVEPGSDATAHDEAGHALQSSSQRDTYEVREYEPLGIPLDRLYVGGQLNLYPEILASKYLRAYLQGNEVVFTASNFVGHIPLNDRVALDVVPRVPVGNLTRILRIAAEAPIALEGFVRAYAEDNDPLPTVFDELVAAFIGAATDVVHQGLFTSYQARTEDTSFPRGRILVGETMRRHSARGNQSRVATRRYERTVDNAVNRLIKYALWLIDQRYARVPNRRGIQKIRTSLNRLYRAFTAVPLDRNERFLDDPLISDPHKIPFSRIYFVNAVQLGLLLIRNRGLDLDRRHGGPIRLPSLLIDLETAFESYLRNVLRERYRTAGLPIVVLDGNRSDADGAKKGLFDEPGSQDATADIVLHNTSEPDLRGPALVVEVKYKRVIGVPDRADLNQVIAYGASYRAPSVVLAHPREKGQPGGLRLVGSIGNLRVHQYGYDLTADLDAEEVAFAAAARALIPPAGARALQRGDE